MHLAVSHHRQAVQQKTFDFLRRALLVCCYGPGEWCENSNHLNILNNVVYEKRNLLECKCNKFHSDMCDHHFASKLLCIADLSRSFKRFFKEERIFVLEWCAILLLLSA